jgi:hypothetical protein
VCDVSVHVVRVARRSHATVSSKQNPTNVGLHETLLCEHLRDVVCAMCTQCTTYRTLRTSPHDQRAIGTNNTVYYAIIVKNAVDALRVKPGLGTKHL